MNATEAMETLTCYRDTGNRTLFVAFLRIDEHLSGWGTFFWRQNIRRKRESSRGYEVAFSYHPSVEMQRVRELPLRTLLVDAQADLDAYAAACGLERA